MFLLLHHIPMGQNTAVDYKLISVLPFLITDGGVSSEEELHHDLSVRRSWTGEMRTADGMAASRM